jgi:chromosome partitioning protein
MPTIITVATRKGGAAKTTTAVHVAHGLALRDAQVLLIDLDSQGQCATWLGRDAEPGLYGAVVQNEPLRNLTRSTGRAGLDLLPGNSTTIAASKHAERERLTFDFLVQAVEEHPTRYDFIVFDSPPLGWFQEMALVLANTLIVPTPLDALSVEGVASILATAMELRQRREFDQRLILPTFMDNTGESNFHVGLLRESFPGSIARPVPRRVAVREAVAFGQTLFEYAPRNEAAEAYAALVESVGLADEEILFGEG